MSILGALVDNRGLVAGSLAHPSPEIWPELRSSSEIRAFPTKPPFAIESVADYC